MSSGKKGRKFEWPTILDIRSTYEKNREKKKNEIRNSKKDRVSTYTLSADHDCAQSTIHGIVTRKTYKVPPKEWTRTDQEPPTTLGFSYRP